MHAEQLLLASYAPEVSADTLTGMLAVLNGDHDGAALLVASAEDPRALALDAIRFAAYAEADFLGFDGARNLIAGEVRP